MSIPHDDHGAEYNDNLPGPYDYVFTPDHYHFDHRAFYHDSEHDYPNYADYASACYHDYRHCADLRADYHDYDDHHLQRPADYYDNLADYEHASRTGRTYRHE